MEERLSFTDAERQQTLQLIYALRGTIGSSLSHADVQALREHIGLGIATGAIRRMAFGLNPVLFALQTVQIAIEETVPGRDSIIAIFLYMTVAGGQDDIQSLRETFGDGVADIISGLVRIHELYKKNPVIESDNFRNLLISFAADIRVILIMIVDRVNMMRQIRDAEDDEARRRVSEEAGYLYAPLAHKLGLYRLKSELEDLSLKYLEHDAYYMIKEKLNATKRSRDAYIERFITPVSEKLSEAGLKFHIKGRTKSIHSIWQKMKKQKCGFEGIYDLFAIRIILDSPLKREKMQCWQAYSIVTDMYMPNPKRLRDWLTVPKSNGYESLHITVLGPEQKWVEVQIRTERMDEVAEKGLAAHWRYKGIKGESGLDEWLGNIRNALETGDDQQLMDQFRLDLYEDEVFVFSPKGQIFKFPKGATVLDFAYTVHTDVGNHCVGASINGRNAPLRQRLQSGDTIEVLTQNSQKPKQDWLNIVKTSRAKSKIRLALKDTQVKEGRYAKELLERRFHNRKIEMSEGILSHVVRKLGFKEMTDFYKALAEERLDVNDVMDKYVEEQQRDEPSREQNVTSAEQFNFDQGESQATDGGDNVLVIGSNLKGVDYSLAKCCHPIYGDDIFGFVMAGGGVKIHRTNCPNAPEMRRRHGYRIIKAKWSGKDASKYGVTLRVVGTDNIGVVTNLTSIISKEPNVTMRSINIDSDDGLFSGNIIIMLSDLTQLKSLIKKLQVVRGVKSIVRI